MPVGHRRAFNAEEARSALRAAVPDLEARERGKQIEIANGGQWYAAGERLRPSELVTGLLQREQDALGLGYSGLRTNGDCVDPQTLNAVPYIAHRPLIPFISR
jgi:hypothetical protein